jgi:hypothetical protein
MPWLDAESALKELDELNYLLDTNLKLNKLLHESQANQRLKYYYGHP